MLTSSSFHLPPHPISIISYPTGTVYILSVVGGLRCDSNFIAKMFHTATDLCSDQLMISLSVCPSGFIPMRSNWPRCYFFWTKNIGNLHAGINICNQRNSQRVTYEEQGEFTAVANYIKRHPGWFFCSHQYIVNSTGDIAPSTNISLIVRVIQHHPLICQGDIPPPLICQGST